MPFEKSISGIRLSFITIVLLWPGMVAQFIIYFSVGGSGNYGGVRAMTRVSRSPFMTVFLSICLYPVIFFWFRDLLEGFQGASAP